MTVQWLCPDLLFDGEYLHDDLALQIDGDTTVAVGLKSQIDLANCRQVSGLISPGFVDLQVNGGGGILLNHNPTVAGMQAIAAAHHGVGTVAIMPTVITDAPEVLDQVAVAAKQAKQQRFFAGLHIEGPHIAPTRRGTHAAQFIRPLDARTMALVFDLRKAGVTVMLTLAPEAATLAQISALSGKGVIVSLGHSDATAEQAQAAFAAGAQCVTHIFNAMSPMQGRAPGLVGAAINSTAFAGMIADGIHVDDDMLALAIRARPEDDRMFLVSDAMPTVGGGDAFSLYGREIRLKDGRLINAEGNLAGAHISQADGVARLVHHLGLPVEAALRMAVFVPTQLINAPQLRQLVGRQLSDIIVLDKQLKFSGVIENHLA